MSKPSLTTSQALDTLGFSARGRNAVFHFRRLLNDGGLGLDLSGLRALEALAANCLTSSAADVLHEIEEYETEWALRDNGNIAED